LGLKIGIVIQQAVYSRLYGGQHQLTGVGWYVVNLVRALAQADTPNHFKLIYASPSNHDAYARSLLGLEGRPDFELVRLPLPVPLTYASWHFLGLPRVEWVAGGLDVLHVPSIAVRTPSRCAQVVTVHDVTHWAFPEVYSRRARMFADYTLARARASQSLVIVPCRHVAQELTRLGFREEGVRCTYYCGSLGPSGTTDSDPTAALAALGVVRPYILFVGASTKRKNLPTLVAAYSRLPKDIRDRHQLVLAGPRADDSEAVASAIENADLRSRVLVTGYLSDENLRMLHQNAALFVMPSLSEGFGIPVVDSMQLGVPVAVSDAGSLAEIVGEAGLLFDPRSPDSIAQAMTRGLTDAKLREALVARGMVAASGFSWEKTARETLAVYEEAAARGRP